MNKSYRFSDPVVGIVRNVMAESEASVYEKMPCLVGRVNLVQDYKEEIPESLSIADYHDAAFYAVRNIAETTGHFGDWLPHEFFEAVGMLKGIEGMLSSVGYEKEGDFRTLINSTVSIIESARVAQ